MIKKRTLLTLVFFLISAVVLYKIFMINFMENRILKMVIQRLEAESRIAEVLVTNLAYDETEKEQKTTIKFLEYGTDNRPLEPKYFTFSGNIIQFQSLVIRFNDAHIKNADKLRGKSIHLFWKVFMLDGKNTQEYEITKMNRVPEGYQVESKSSEFEEKIWKQFWEYALNNEKKNNTDIKNAQIEAPGTMFVPGQIYTIKIEHDGGMRIDSVPMPSILKGEKIPE